MDKLISLLKENARFSNEQLATMLDTTPEDIESHGDGALRARPFDAVPSENNKVL